MTAKSIATPLLTRALMSLRLQSPKVNKMAAVNSARLLHQTKQIVRNARYYSNQLQISAVSQPAPNFHGTVVINGDFKDVSLSDFAGKYVVLMFYPMDFTFVCPTEILAFSDRAKEFEDCNTQVIACSVDSKFSHLAWMSASRKNGGLGGDLNIPLLSDITRTISKDYGVLLEHEGITLRGLFIIDGNGILRQATVNDLPVGRSVDETLRLIKAFQFTDKHGEVCPVDWQPGADTIKPDPKESKEYFSKQ